MGSTYSTEEINSRIENLKSRIYNFNGTYTSAEYKKLYKEMNQIFSTIPKVRKSAKTRNTHAFGEIEKSLLECNHLLITKARRNSDMCNKAKEEVVTAIPKIKRDPADILSALDKEVQRFEMEIEDILENNDKKKREYVEAKLKLCFTEAALIKAEKGSFLELKKNQIWQKLERFYVQIYNIGDFNAHWEYDSGCGGSSARTSTRSSINELFNESVELSKTKQYYKRSTFHEQDNFDDIINIEKCDYKQAGSRELPVLNKDLELNLDELLQYTAYDKKEMNEFFKEVEKVTLSCKNKVNHDNFGRESFIDIPVTNRMKKKPKAPIVKISQSQERNSNSNDCPKKQIHPPVLREAKLNRKIYPPILRLLQDRNENLIENSTKSSKNSVLQRKGKHKKIYPPVLRLPKNKRGSANELHEEAEVRKIYPPVLRESMKDSKSDEETQDDVNKKNIKIYAPVLKIVENETVTESERKHAEANDCISTEKYSNVNVLPLEVTDFGEDLMEYSSKEDNCVDALNFDLLKRLSLKDDEVDDTTCNRVVEVEEPAEEKNSESSEDIDTEVRIEEVNNSLVTKENPENKNKKYFRIRNKGNKRRSSLVDGTDKIAAVLENIEELKCLNENFKETQNYTIYGDIQEKLMIVIRIMFDMDKSKFDQKSLILYEIVSQNIQEFVNEL